MLRTTDRDRVHASNILQAQGLSLHTPNGRVLIDRLNMTLGKQDRVAVVGHNGVGKSTLLRVLACEQPAESGRVVCNASVEFVRQQMDCEFRDVLMSLPEASAIELSAIGLPSLSSLWEKHGVSRGELRKLLLLKAKYSGADLLILDEPTQDLDTHGITWLLDCMGRWQGGLIVASHHSHLLREFHDFFIVAESGCRYLSGPVSTLEELMLREMELSQQKYVRTLNRLAKKEEHNAKVARRRRRKKMGGRVREIDRAPSRAILNSKRSYAQESQGKQAKLQTMRIGAARSWAKSARRALSVSLPLTSVLPVLPKESERDSIALSSVSVLRNGKTLFGPIDLRVNRQRIAVTGDNGAGKTTLLNVMLGLVKPSKGDVRLERTKIGTIAQGGSDWMQEDSLLTLLMRCKVAFQPDELASVLAAHRFPFALSERPLCSLSPGERVRAALLCLFEQTPQVEVLVLDEPTYSLDFTSAISLRAVLSAWSGGLVIASHDQAFLAALNIDREISLEK